MNTTEVLEIEDHFDYGLPEVDSEYDPAVTGLPRADRSQTAGDQPARRSLVHPRRLRAGLAELVDAAGLQLPRGPGHLSGGVRRSHSTGPGGSKRDVAYRISFAEMIVPYRDPSPDHYRRTAYDIGEWGLGYIAASLELGCDCLRRDRLRGCRRARLDRRAGRDHQAGHLPARRGQRRALEARRRRTRHPGPAPRCAGWSSPCTPRWPITSTSSTGASTKTATSSARYGPPA